MSGARAGLGRRLVAMLPALMVTAGLVVLAWPVVLDLWSAHKADGVVAEAAATWDALSDPERLECLEQARAWNDRMSGATYQEPAGGIWDYGSQLTWRGTPESMMAWVEVPRIGVRLPIYHGTSEEVLSAGVGHCDWSALPVGGTGSHCVLTAHSGMRRQRMFDDLRSLEVGDVFVVWSLGEAYAYRVATIAVVEPHELDALAPESGRDLCTLVTCTPLGVNSHRLLVTGERCAWDSQEASPVTGTEAYVNRRSVPLLAGIAATGAAAAVFVVLTRKKRRDSRREQ